MSDTDTVVLHFIWEDDLQEGTSVEINEKMYTVVKVMQTDNGFDTFKYVRLEKKNE